jgi:hypothetical protein
MLFGKRLRTRRVTSGHGVQHHFWVGLRGIDDGSRGDFCGTETSEFERFERPFDLAVVRGFRGIRYLHGR